MTTPSVLPGPVPEPPFRLAGLGLVLREWTDADLPAMTELFDDAEVARWTPLASPFDAAAAEGYLARAREARGLGRRIQLAVTVDGGAPLGEVLAMIKDSSGDVEVGYAIGPAHRRQGLSGRSVRLLTDFCHDTLAAQRVVLRIDPGNEASNAVARSAGFRLADEPPVLIPDPAGGEITLRIWEHRSAAPAE
jgi:RimJ/RimL family protein N-acetyltransferase